jgi:hypothetical protein
MLGVDHPAVEVDVVVGGVDHAVVEERERHLVAGAVDDDVDLGGGAVLEEHLGVLEPVDVGLDGDVAVPEPGQQVVADRGMRVQHGMVGLGQPVVGDPAPGQPQRHRHRELLQPHRSPGDRRVGQVVGRDAEEVLRDDVGAAAHRQVGLVGGA